MFCSALLCAIFSYIQLYSSVLYESISCNYNVNVKKYLSNDVKYLLSLLIYLVFFVFKWMMVLVIVVGCGALLDEQIILCNE